MRAERARIALARLALAVGLIACAATAAHAQDEGDEGDFDLEEVVPDLFDQQARERGRAKPKKPAGEPAPEAEVELRAPTDAELEAQEDGVPEPVIDVPEAPIPAPAVEAEPAGGAAPDPADPSREPAGPAEARAPPAEPAEPAAEGAQPASPAFEPDWEELGRETDLRAHLEAHAGFVRGGDNASADLELARVEELRLKLGVRNVPLASALLVHEARVALSKNDPGRAVAWADAAARLSPDLVAAHWMRLQASFHFDRFAFLQHGRIAADALAARTRGFRNEVALATDLTAIAALALLALAIAFGAIMAAKYLRYLAHDLVRPLPAAVSEAQGFIAAVLLLLAPLVFGLGIGPAAALWIASVFAYQTRRERVVAAFALVTISLLPGAIYAAAPLVTFHGSVVDALDRASTHALATRAEEQLERHLAGPGRNDFETALVLARRARIRGDFEAAVQRYREALLIRPDSVEAKTNLGNIHFYMRKPDEALRQYEAAANARRRAEPWLNIASVLLDDSRFDDARAAIVEARAIDRALTRRYSDLDTDISTIRKLMDVPFDDGVLWSRLFDLPGDQRMALTAELWGRLGSRLPPIAMPAIGFGLLAIASVLAFKRKRFALSSGCTMCGMPAAPDAPEGYCPQCQSIFLESAAVEPRTKKRKERHIRIHQHRVRWTERLLAIVPGAGDLYGGRPIAGAIVLLLASAAVLASVWVDRFSADSWAVWSAPALPQIALYAAAAVTLGLFSLVRAFSR